jgi:hypothetical protein
VKRILYKICWGKYHIGDKGVDGRIMLRKIFIKCGFGAGTRSVCFRIRTGGGTSEYTDETSGSIKNREILDQLKPG